MQTIEAGTRVTFRSILFLTDFSEPSEVAIPFVSALAREHGAKAFALHVFSPPTLAYASAESATTIGGLEEGAEKEMERLDSQLSSVDHETMIVRGESVWSTVIAHRRGVSRRRRRRRRRMPFPLLRSIMPCVPTITRSICPSSKTSEPGS